jgi:hypothetical protein
MEDGYAAKVRRQTVLQQHCNFWDRDNDGVIWPLDTYRGFYELGYGTAMHLRMTIELIDPLNAGVILSFIALVM